ncbi:SKIP/SNW domain-containing protein [Paraphysoderma sedebokerense]|nr:SKIP/SNW domain-containing protein [Paraphysoderma sedebokerense]
MSTLASILPKPKIPLSSSSSSISSQAQIPPSTAIVSKKSGPPPYGQRRGFIPRTFEDYGDGGAYPEIHVAQYPLDIGRSKGQGQSTLAVTVDAEGNIAYDAVARHGHGKDRIIHSQYKDLVPMDISNDANEWAKPDDEEIQKTTEKTREALEKIVSGKIKASQPKSVAIRKPNEPTFIKYTPGNQSDRHNSGANSRIIRMVEMPVDPMEPPKFGFKKLPKPPPSPPAPIMHSPPRKVSAKEAAEWNIPPCISNWKNAKGYTIPLDKRLAADGRGLQEVAINDNFAKFAEAMMIAERHARDEVRQRALMQQKLAQKEKAQKEEHLRMLAQKAREERAGIVPAETESAQVTSAETRADRSPSRSPRRRGRSETPESSEAESSEDETTKAAKERDAIRKQKQADLRRELRMNNMGADAKARHAKLMSERDISEKIALGIAQPTATGDTIYDQRLYNQSEGIGSGFASEDAYNIYDKPLFNQTAISSIYRPTTAITSDAYAEDATETYNKIVGSDRFSKGLGTAKGFSGTDGKAQERDGH